jgi:general secretion pathway protein M
MMAAFREMWAARSTREQWMLGVMFGLMAVVLLWFGLVRPINAARVSTRTAMLDAADRNAGIRAKVAMLKRLPAQGASAGAATPLDQFVGQSAGEAGLTLERAQAQGEGRIDIAIASVRPIALFSWLAQLERQGVRVETMRAQPAPTAGSVSMQAVLVRGNGAG